MAKAASECQLKIYWRIECERLKDVSHQKRATRAKNHTEVTVKYDSDSEDPTGKAPSAEEENTGPESDGSENKEFLTICSYHYPAG